MKNVNFLIVAVCVASTIFGMQEDLLQSNSSRFIQSSSPHSIRVVDKKGSEDFLIRRKSSGSSRSSSDSLFRNSSRSRFSPTDECPLGPIDGRVDGFSNTIEIKTLLLQKLAENREQK